MSKEIQTTLDWTTVPSIDLIPTQKVIEIDGSLSVEEACQILVENNISSAPVYDEGGKGDYVGMFDYGDVIAYILLVLHRSPGQRDSEDKIDLESFEIKDIVHRALKGQKVPVRMASDLSRKNPFYSIQQDDSLLSAIEIFASGTHRVSLLKRDGTIQGILSQSTLIRHLFENRKNYPQIDQIFDKTIRQLKLGGAPVISVDCEATVLDALSIMSKNGVSSIVVLRDGKYVLGNISMTDAKHIINGSTPRLLWKSCLHFISHVKKQQGVDDGQDRIPVFDVRLDTSIGFAIAKLLATKTHRVWVIDEKNQVIGVVSLTDIIRAIASLEGVKVDERRTSIAIFRN